MREYKKLFDHQIHEGFGRCVNCQMFEMEILATKNKSCRSKTEIKETIMVEKAFIIDDIETRFNYHKPHGNQPERYNAIRQKLKEMAYFIIENTPNSIEQGQAILNLEKAMFWANASIARHEKESIS